MANIKDLKKRIKSTKGTFKITTAMKLVSAAKLARAQEAILSSRPYTRELEQTIKTISALVQGYTHPYLREQDNQRAIILVISSDRGLCGNYNSSLAKFVRQFVQNNAELDLKLYNFGKKVKSILKKDVQWGKTFVFAKQVPEFKDMSEIAKELGQLFQSGEVGKVFVAYNHFQNAITFLPTIKMILPIALSSDERIEVKRNFPFDFKYDLTPEKILDQLIPDTLSTIVFSCLLDAKASEHGARMSAMDNASKNCKDLIKTLTLKMNKLRQAAITTELIEVVSGAEALNGQ